MAYGRDIRSIPELFIDVVNRLSMLIRTEAQLAQVEISEKITRGTSGLGFVVAGAILLIPALVILLQAAAAALVGAGFTTAQAAGIIGGAVFVIGLILVLVGVSMLKSSRLTPDKTIKQLQRDVEVAKQQMRETNDTVQRAA